MNRWALSSFHIGRLIDRHQASSVNVTSERGRKHSRLGRGGKDIFYEPVEWEIQEPPPLLEFDPKTGWTSESSRVGAICKKLGMIGVFNEWGEHLPLTVLQVAHCAVSQIKTVEKEGYDAVQISGKEQLPRRMTKPLLKHLEKAGLPGLQYSTEFRLNSSAGAPAVGTRIYAKHFVPGQFLDIQGTTIGKGFQGGMKRWGFGGQNASHGHSLSHRAIGSTGAHQDPGRVWPGKKMAGRMGGKRRTAKNLRLWRVTPGLELLWVLGCVPGHRNAYVKVADAKNKRHAQPPPFPTWDPQGDAALGQELTMAMPPPQAGESWFWKPAAADERKPIDALMPLIEEECVALMEEDREFRDFRNAEIKSVKEGSLPWYFEEKRVAAFNEKYDYAHLDKFLTGQLGAEEAKQKFFELTSYRSERVQFEEDDE